MVTETLRKEPKTNTVVTYLVGNGFDIGLGLHTSYIDFINSYLREAAKTQIIAHMKNEIVKDLQSWGDAELAFGKLQFSTFGDDSHSAVKECLADFGDSLFTYLACEERRFLMPNDKQKLDFSTRFFSYYQSLGEYARIDEIESVKRYGALKVNVINFNYTETIDKMLVPSGVIKLPECGEINVRVSPICHVHGALSTKRSRLFGVNDIAQVIDPKLSNESKRLLAKPVIDRLAGCHLGQKARDMIDESDTVIVFGMSMGASDKVWWEYLANHIRDNTVCHRLCLVPYVSCQRGATCLAEEGEWAEMERLRFYNAIDVKKHFYNVEKLGESIDVFIRGPYVDPEGEQVFCDPFCLSWFGNKLVSSVDV